MVLFTVKKSHFSNCIFSPLCLFSAAKSHHTTRPIQPSVSKRPAPVDTCLMVNMRTKGRTQQNATFQNRGPFLCRCKDSAAWIYMISDDAGGPAHSLEGK